MIAMIYNTTLTLFEPPYAVLQKGSEAIEQYINLVYDYSPNEIIWGVVEKVNDQRGE
jgi:hypothetical protein